MRRELDEATRKPLFHAGDIARVKEEGIKTQEGPAAALAPIRKLLTGALVPAAPEPPQPKLWLSLEEAAAYSGLEARTLKRLCEEGKLVGIKEWRSGWKIRRASLEAFAG